MRVKSVTLLFEIEFDFQQNALPSLYFNPMMIISFSAPVKLRVDKLFEIGVP